ncbi:MAG: PrsW family intramembrane metalloprotease [Corynebacterium sp.]|nr:PrsW family intramembrane metalloprotease [Corynebacterium sp.]
MLNFEVFVLLNLGCALLWAAFSIAVFFLTPLRRLCPPRTYHWLPLAILWGMGQGCLYLIIPDLSNFATLINWEESAYSWGGAYPEETTKLAGALIICFLIPQIRRPWHFAVVGFFVGLGFEIFENIGYGITAGLADPISDFHGLLYTWAFRVILGPWFHALLVAISAYIVGWAFLKVDLSTPLRWLLGFAGWFAAFALHFVFNYNIIADNSYYIRLALVTLISWVACGFIIWHSFRMRKKELLDASSNWEFC